MRSTRIAQTVSAQNHNARAGWKDRPPSIVRTAAAAEKDHDGGSLVRSRAWLFQGKGGSRGR